MGKISNKEIFTDPEDLDRITWIKNIIETQAKKFNPSQIEFDDALIRFTGKFLKHIKSIEKALSRESLASEYKHHINNNEKHILSFEQYRSKSIKKDQDVNDGVFWFTTAIEIYRKLLSDLEPKDPPHRPLAELITHDKSVEIVDQIKVRYKNIRGKHLQILLKALQHLDLYPKSKMAKKFHVSCGIEFDWDIGTYTAMNDYKHFNDIDDEEFNGMILFLENLIITK